MPTTPIVVLANSIKHFPGRCVAGRTFLAQPDGTYQLGEWIRPVSTTGEGELLPQHMRVAGGGEFSVLDVVEAPLLNRHASPAQPENHLIDSSVPWRKIGAWPAANTGALRESPFDLWCEPGQRTDRVRAEYLIQNPPSQSLYMLHLPSCKLVRSGGKVRMQFRYNIEDYSLAVTDPSARSKLALDQAELDLGARYVCVSLAPPLNGFHYKIVATVLW